jgi:hypothetical protein
MKHIFLAILFLLSFPVWAEDEYFLQAKATFDLMIKAKQEKDQTIRGSRGQPEAQRAKTIHGALELYALKMKPLIDHDQRLQDAHAQLASQAEWEKVSAVRGEVSKFLHDESAMEEAAKEINLTADQ